jgi:thymidylate synthase (FAD)
MQFRDPRTYLLAATKIEEEFQDFLADVGAPNWTTDAASDAEVLVEAAGRLCYKSFEVGLNPNVTRIREGNTPYIGNILASKHGSVLEHATATFALMGVSRIVTHELVRHRVGTGYSQESLRFVRLDKIEMPYPEVGFGPDTLLKLFENLPDETQRLLAEVQGDLFDADPAEFEKAKQRWVGKTAKDLRAEMRKVAMMLESVQQKFSAKLRLDEAKDFGAKKKITSAMRRLAPEGLGTAIIITANHRTWRDIIERRTSRHAEEEIRLVFSQVFPKLAQRFPAIYQDAKQEIVDGIPEIVFTNTRV